MVNKIKELRLILTGLAIFLALNLLSDIGDIILNFKRPSDSFFEMRIYYAYYIADVLLFFMLRRFTFYKKVYLWILGAIVIAIKFILLINFYLMEPYELYSVFYNDHYCDFFDMLGLNLVSLLLFGNNLFSFFLFSALYGYLIYLYIKIVKQQIHERGR